MKRYYIAVSKDEVVTRGQTIGKSGTSNVEKDLGNHVHFELIVAGNTVNPETYFLNQNYRLPLVLFSLLEYLRKEL